MKNILILSTVAFVFWACSFSPKYYTHSGEIFGTRFNIKYEYNKNLSKQIDSLLNNFNNCFSNYNPNSIISKINNNETHEINDLINNMFQTSFEVNQTTNGAFDITVAPIVNLWGFGWKKNHNKNIPDSALIDSVLQYVGMDKIQVIGNKIVKTCPNVTVVVNAIAKGLSVDYISEYFDSLQIKNYLVEIGGEVYCKGINHKKKNWTLGIEKPIENSNYDNRENQIRIQINEKGIATSGNYRQFLEYNKQKYGHTIDPRTGYPAKNSLLSVSVISESTMLSDAYATAFMVSGLEESIKILENLKNIDVYFIYLDENLNEKTYATKGFENMYVKNVKKND